MDREIIFPPLEGYRFCVPTLDDRKALMIIYPAGDISPGALMLLETYPEGKLVFAVAFKPTTALKRLRDASRAIETFGYARVFERTMVWTADKQDSLLCS